MTRVSKSATTPEAKEATQVLTRAKGRRTRAQRALQPYPSPRKRSDTGRYVWSYLDPDTGLYRKNVMLLDATSGHPVQSEVAAHKAAARCWRALTESSTRLAHGLTPAGRFDPRELLEPFIAHQRLQSSRPDIEEDSIRRAFLDLGLYSRFAQCADLSTVYGEYADKIRADLTTAAATLTERRFRDPDNWVRTRLILLQRMLWWAERRLGMVVRANGLASVSAEFGRPRRAHDFFYPLQQAAAVERALKYHAVVSRDPFLWMAMWLLLYTGARRSEVFCLRVRDVLVDGTERHPNGALRIWTSKQERHKRRTGTPDFREVPLFPKLRKVFEQFVSELGLGPDDFLCLSGKRVERLKKSGMHFERPKAVYCAISALTQTALYRYMKAICAAAGVPYNAGCHVWRHTYVATRGRMAHPTGNAVTFSDLQGEVGHIEGSRTTRDIYDKASQVPLPGNFTHLDWRLMDRAAQKMRRQRRARVMSKSAPPSRRRNFASTALCRLRDLLRSSKRGVEGSVTTSS